MSEGKVVVRISAQADKAVKSYAAAHKVSHAEAADALISVADRRLSALKKYSKRTKAPVAKARRSKAVRAAKPKAAPKAKKAAAKKAS